MALATSAKYCVTRKAVKTSSPASETDESTSTSNIYTNLSTQQNQSTQRENTPASGGKTPSGSSPTRVQPFCGFTAKQIDAARQRCIEAQKRQEAIISLMRAKLLNKDDLTIIEPVVLEHRKQKAKQCHKVAERYPRRNINRKNYHESSEADETVDEDTSTCSFHCDKCKTEYEGHHNCDASGHLSNTELDSRAPFYNVVKSLPDDLLVKESPAPSTGCGVFTRQFTTLRKDTIYGPFEGVSIYNESEAHQSGYCWPVFSKHKISHWIDARQIHRSNWLRYMRHAASVALQNVCAYQVGQNIYYRIVADIGSGTELLVWYGDDYARELGLHSAVFIAGVGVELACYECQLEFRCRQRLKQHKLTTHSNINSDTAAVANATRCVSNNVAASDAKSGVAARNGKLTVAESTGSASSGAVVLKVTMLSAGGKGSATRSCKPHRLSVGSTESEGFGTPDTGMTDLASDKCQVTAGSARPGVAVRQSVDVSCVAVSDDCKRFQCKTCCKLFKSRALVVRHTYIHTGEKPFECTTCGQWFRQNRNLTTHRRIHTGEKPFECTKCGKRFTQSSHLTTHSRIHTNEKPFECTTCGQMFTQSGHLLTHHRLHTGERPFECTACGQRFNERSLLTTHSRIHTGEKPFKCTKCGQKFRRNGHLTLHSRMHTGEKLFECTMCGQMFTQSCNLTTHSRIHTGEKPFECTECGQRFAASGNLSIHSRIHTGQKPFECTTCGQMFTSSGHLTTHSRIHTGEKPFECTTCGQMFRRSDHLTTHSRIHTGEKPFKCIMCGQRFVRIGDLTKHSRIHTGEKPFKCTKCGRMFSASGNLTTHSRIHTGEKPFECITCGQMFTRSGYLTTHSRIHTGEKPF